tara:strand:+ start:261 stop:1181 length:921 start_codon:yes stop_codon:yes gene_type:complete
MINFKRLYKSPPHRQLYVLGKVIKILKWAINYFDFKGDIMVNRNGSYVGTDGVFLQNEGTNRYLKSKYSEKVNEGFDLYQKINQVLDNVSVIFDVGANFGEISLFLSKMYPSSKIYAVEPSRKNLIKLRENIKLNFFDTSNINIIETAVCNFEGKIKITSSYGSQNTIMLDPKNNRQINKHNQNFIDETEEVNATTLKKICEENEINEIDFIKIDIEGSEPLLTNDIKELRPKLIYMEISDKNTSDSYQKMLTSLKDEYEIYDLNLKVVKDHSSFVSSVFSKKSSYYYNVSATDVWLIRKDINKVF